MATDPQIPPVPSNFGVRYVLWAAWWLFWSNAVSLLQTLQLIAVYLEGDPTDPASHPFVSRTALHWITLANGVLSIVLLQIKRKKPDLVPPPTKVNP
jgi:hypothetical protein